MSSAIWNTSSQSVPRNSAPHRLDGSFRSSRQRRGATRTTSLVVRSCSALAVVGAIPMVGPRVVFGAPGSAGDGRLVAVSPAGFADIAVDPSAGSGRSDRRCGVSRRLTAWCPRHGTVFSRSISRKIAWPAWLGDATRNAAKSSGSSSRVTRKAPRRDRCLMRLMRAAAKVC
jgi:hypothetical protein